MMEAEQIAILFERQYKSLEKRNHDLMSMTTELAAKVADLEAQLAARDAEIVRLKVMIGRIIEAAEDDPDYALPEAINEVQAEMVLDALHANGLAARPANGDS